MGRHSDDAIGFIILFYLISITVWERHWAMGQRDVVVASDIVGFLSSPEFINKLNVLNSFAINVLSFNELFVYLYPIF